MILQTALQHEKYLRENLIDPPRKMLDCGFDLQAVLLMAQSFEIYGAYFDNKPFRASGQSLKRFNLAIKNLFNYKYHLSNRNNMLYTQMRAMFIHSLLPGEGLLIKQGGTVAEHLQISNGIITIIPAVLHEDVKEAGINLIERLNTGTIIPKRISTSWFS